VCATPAIERVFAPQQALMDLMERRRPQFTDLYRSLKTAFREFTS
jgi:hypothetical protein